jgi:hypothetical protein
MTEHVYSANDGSGMTEDDVWSWIKFILRSREIEYRTFDKLTGGRTDFFCIKAYLRLKHLYESYHETVNCAL